MSEPRCLISPLNVLTILAVLALTNCSQSGERMPVVKSKEGKGKRDFYFLLAPYPLTDYSSQSLWKLSRSSVIFRSFDSTNGLRLFNDDIDTTLYDIDPKHSVYGVSYVFEASYSGTVKIECLGQTFGAMIIESYPVRYTVVAEEDSMIVLSTEFMQGIVD